MGLEALRPLDVKFAAGGDIDALDIDFLNVIRSPRDLAELRTAPILEYVGVAEVKVAATADSPSRVLMSGFPNIIQPGHWLRAALSDGYYRANTADTSMAFATSSTFWGTEKTSQWYAVLAVAGNTDTAFTLKAMPWMRFKSQASQVISLGLNLTPGTGIGYGFTADELVGGKIYVVSGAHRGILRTILHNNNNNTNAGTIEYSGTNLASMAEGDWFIVLPPVGVNFRWLGDFFNNSGSNIDGDVDDIVFGRPYYFYTDSGIWLCPFAWTRLYDTGIGGGAKGGTGGSGQWGTPGTKEIKARRTCVPGVLNTVTIGAGGVYGGAAATATALGSILSLAGGNDVTTDPVAAVGLLGNYGRGGPETANGSAGCLLIKRAF